MTLWVTRSQRSHDGRNACAGGMGEWCGRRVTNEARDTNAQLCDYKRTRGKLRAVRQF